MEKNSIGNRMKENYEDRYRIKLIRRIPVIIRLDGKSFHTLTRQLTKPFDEDFSRAMQYTARYLCEEIQGCKCAYQQSDEISLLLIDFDRLSTDAWFDYNLQKMVSIAASMASATFTNFWNYQTKYGPIKKGDKVITSIFDCRAFNIPKEEVCNYFIWRQKDWIRNSIQMLAHTHYSHKQLHKKNTNDMHDMLHNINFNWANLDPVWKNGTFLSKQDKGWIKTHHVIFTEDREIIEQYMNPVVEA